MFRHLFWRPARNHFCVVTDFAAMANRFVTDVPEYFGFFGPGFSQHHITPFMDKPE
jgi:hypothetical protein